VLELTDLRVHYGNVAAVDGVSVTVEEGEIVAIIGPNGAGKTSTLRALSGLVRASGGRVVFRGVDISRWRPHRIVGLGLSHAPEGRRLFAQMSVLENLKMGAYRRRDGDGIERSLAEVLERFPRLAERRHQLAGRAVVLEDRIDHECPPAEQDADHDGGGADGPRVVADASRRADRGDTPQAGRGGKTLDSATGAPDRPGAEEADADDDATRDA